MSEERWIVVPNWERFQHYRDRNPPWIKNYTALLHKDEYLRLSLTQRGLLHGIWLAYAASGGLLKTRAPIRSWLRADVRPISLERLNDAGLIAFSASPPLSLSLKRSRARAREPGEAVSARARAERWIRNGVAAEVPLDHLAEVIADEFKVDDAELLADLVAQAKEMRQT